MIGSWRTPAFVGLALSAAVFFGIMFAVGIDAWLHRHK